jgi:hypothetical protein
MANPFATCFSNLTFKDSTGKSLNLDITGEDMDCAILENPQYFNAKAASFSQADKDAVYNCISDKVKNNTNLCCELSRYNCNPQKYSYCDNVDCGDNENGGDDSPGKFDENCENPFQYCSNPSLDSSDEDSVILKSCCGSETDQKQLGQFNSSCDTFFDKYVSDSAENDSDGQVPFCQTVGNNPLYAPACKYCANAPDFDECAIKHINEILKDNPDYTEDLCQAIDISAAGEGTTNASSCGDSGLGRGCFLCRYCNKCGSYNPDLCQGVVHSPEDNNDTKDDSDSGSASEQEKDKSKGLSNVDIGIIVIASLLLLSILYYYYRSSKKN